MTNTPINKSYINKDPINGTEASSSASIDIVGTFNSYVLNTVVVDGALDVIAVIDAQEVVLCQQNVGIKVNSADVCAFEQDVQFKCVFEGIIVEIEQQVNTLFSGKVISLDQNVIDKSVNTFFKRNGWDVVLVIGGYIIPQNIIFKDINISEEEDQSNQCVFSLLLEDPITFIDAMWGQPVSVDYITAAGSVRMFTGVVTIPEIDIINKNVKFTCSNNRDELINDNLAAYVPTVGRYSESVQGKYNTAAEQMNLRMQTVPASFDFDGFNTPSLNSWFAKDVPDFTLTDADIYYRVPKVIWQDRTKIKNSFALSLTYQYTRLYQYQVPFSWALPFSFCDFLEWQYSLPTVSMIETAITNAKWLPTSPVIFTSQFPPGSCIFGDATLVFWNTTSLANRGTQTETFDSLGNVISDPDGNNIYGFSPAETPSDLGKTFVNGAQWTGSTRFSQYIEEDYNFNVFSSQSIEQFGAVTDSTSVSIKDDFDASGWETYTAITAEPAGAISFSDTGYYFNAATNPDGMQQAIAAEIDRAKTTIWSTHRNTQVIVETPLKPYFELSHTVAISTGKLGAKGKIQKLSHVLSVAEGKGSTTTVTLALFRSQGGTSTTPTYIPARPSDTIVLSTAPVTLGSHYGVTNPAYNGHIGNKNNPRVIGTLKRTAVQEEFRVDTPAIPDSYRQLRQLPVSADFEVAIPNDPLSINL